MRSRPFLTRLTLAVLGMLLLCVSGAIGLGWAARKPSTWLKKALGWERCSGLQGASIRTLGALLPVDSDGDGLADSVEQYLSHDPHNPRDHPYLRFPGDCPGFNYLISFALQPGERRRIHARASIDILPVRGSRPGTFAPGMRLLLDPEPPGLLCLPGGVPSAGPLLVPVAADGAMEFDLAIRDDAVPNPPGTLYEVEARHPLSDMYVYRLSFDVVWRLPPLPCTVEEVPFKPSDVPMEHVVDVKFWHTVHLAWPPADQAGSYFIEATRDPSSDPHWFAVSRRSGEEHEGRFTYQLYDARPGYRGPMRFRIIPIKPVPPKAPDDKDQPITEYRLREYVPKDLFQMPDPGSFGYRLLPVASIATSPVSAKAILRNIIDTQMEMVAGEEVGSDFILSDVSQLEPTVCKGYYVFQVRVQTGWLIIILNPAQPQAAAHIFRSLRD